MMHSNHASFPDVQLHIVDAPLGADPESRDSGFARKGLAPRNDG
jgi:hypothetical protein